MVREGLARLEGVVSVSESPDAQLGTCDLQTSDGLLVAPATLARGLTAARVGARLRAVEVTFDGRLEKTRRGVFVRIRRERMLIQLESMRRKVNLDPKNRKPAKPTREERSAFRNLLQRWDGSPSSVRLTGLLKQKKESSALKLEVRQFEFHPSTLE